MGQQSSIEFKQYEKLCAWLNQSKESLELIDRPVENLNEEYMNYLQFKTEYDEMSEIFMDFKRKSETTNFIVITIEQWTQVEISYKIVTSQKTRWLRKLDSSLPTRFGNVGEGLFKLEELLNSNMLLSSNNEENFKILKHCIDKYKDILQDKERNEACIRDLIKEGHYYDVPKPQIENLNFKFQTLTNQAHCKLYDLEFAEIKTYLASLLDNVDRLISSWQIKYDTKDRVTMLLNEYQSKVVDTNLCSEINSSFEAAKEKVTILSKAYKGKNNEGVEPVMNDIKILQEKWMNLKVELACVQTSFEETIQHWSNYNVCSDVLRLWLHDADKALQYPLNEKMNFFIDKDATFGEKINTMNKSGSFLFKVSNDEVSSKLENELRLLNRHWKDISLEVDEMMKKEGLTKMRNEYEKAADWLEDWLNDAEEFINQYPRCTSLDLRHYHKELESMMKDEEAAENKFKDVSKLAQHLIEDSSKLIVNQMLERLKRIKQRFVDIRRMSNLKSTTIKVIMPHVETIEEDMTIVQNWVRQAENLLNFNVNDDNLSVLEQFVENFKSHFADKINIELKIENMEEVLSLIKSEGSSVDSTQLEDKINKIKIQYENLKMKSENRECELEKCFKLWKDTHYFNKNVEQWASVLETKLKEENDIDMQLDFAENLLTEIKIKEKDLADLKEFASTLNLEREIEVKPIECLILTANNRLSSVSQTAQITKSNT